MLDEAEDATQPFFGSLDSVGLYVQAYRPGLETVPPLPRLEVAADRLARSAKPELTASRAPPWKYLVREVADADHNYPIAPKHFQSFRSCVSIGIAPSPSARRTVLRQSTCRGDRSRWR